MRLVQTVKGGEYPYKAGLTIEVAVAIAGGYTDRPNTNKAFLRRAGADREVEAALNQRVAINPGDIVRIPERLFQPGTLSCSASNQPTGLVRAATFGRLI